MLPVLRIAQLFTTVTHTITQDEDPAPPIYTTVDCDITMTNPPKAVYFFWDDRSFSIKGPTSFVDNGDGTWSLNVQKIYTDDAPANYLVRYYIFDNFQQFDIGYFVVPVSAP